MWAPRTQGRPLPHQDTGHQQCPPSSGQSYSRKRCSQRNKPSFSSISRYCTSRPHSFPKTYSHCPRKGFFVGTSPTVLCHLPGFSGLIGSILLLTPTTLLLAVFQNLLLPTPAQGGQKRGSQQGNPAVPQDPPCRVVLRIMFE